MLVLAAVFATGAARAEPLDARAFLLEDAPDVGAASFLRALSAVERQGDVDARDRLLDRVVAGAKNADVRALARFRRARIKARRLVETAAADDRALGLVEDAWLIGPFDNTGGAAIERQTPPEVALVATGALDLDASHQGRGQEARWQRLSLDRRSGALRLDQHLLATDEVSAVVAFVVSAPRPTTVALRASASGQLAIYAGGRALLVDEADHGLGFDTHVVPVAFDKGDTLVWMRVGGLDGQLALRVRLTDLDGAALDGVSVTADRERVMDAQVRSPDASPKRSPPPLAVSSVAGALSKRLADTAANDPVSPTVRDRALADALALENTLQLRDRRQTPDAVVAWLEERIAIAEAAVEEADSADGRGRLSRLLAALGQRFLDDDQSRSRAAFERALALEPENARALLGLARLRREQGLNHEALILFRRAQRAAPDDVVVQREVFAFLRGFSQLPLEAEGALFRLADRAPTLDNLELALDIAIERGDAAREAAYARKLAREDPVHFTLTHRQERRVREGAADPASWRALLEKRLLAFPASHRTARRLALAYRSAGEVARARRLVEARQARFPTRPEPFVLEAELALLENDRERSQALLERAIAIHPQARQAKRTLRLLSAQGGDLENRYGIDVDALVAMDEPPPADAGEVGAYVMAHTIAVRFVESGLGTIFEDRVFRVTDPQRARFLRQVATPYAEGREVVEVLRADRLTTAGRQAAMRIVDRGPDGKVGGVYTDVRQKTALFAELNAGDVIHVRTRKELVGRQNLFGDFFGLLEPIQSVLPVQSWRLVVDGPASRPLHWGGRGHGEPKVTEADGRSVVEFVARDVPRMTLEPSMPPYLSQAAYVSVSTYQSWVDMGRWYAALIKDQLLLDDALRKVARDVVKGATTTEEKVRRMYEHVVTSTRYVGIELGIHGWKPYPVTEVHRRRFGDCKDKASLLVALLGEVGVDARITLVRTVNAGRIADGPASMWAFNHAIAYVPELDLFLDGTAERSGWRELPAMDQGAMALVVAPHGSDEESRLVTIPVMSAERNLNESAYDLTLTEDGTLTVRGKETFSGAENARRRSELFDEATRKDRLERSLAGVLPGTRMHTLDVSSLALSEETVWYAFEATIPNRAMRVGSDSASWTMPLSLYPHDLTGSYAARSTRRHPVWMMHPWRTRNVMRYRLPAGVEAVDLPRGGLVENAWLRFEQTITRTDDGFVVDENTTLKSREIPAEAYTAFRDAALKADALMKRKVRLVKKDGDA